MIGACLDALDEVLARQAPVVDALAAPEQLRGYDVVAALPAQLLHAWMNSTDANAAYVRGSQCAGTAGFEAQADCVAGRGQQITLMAVPITSSACIANSVRSQDPCGML